MDKLIRWISKGYLLDILWISEDYPKIRISARYLPDILRELLESSRELYLCAMSGKTKWRSETN